MFSNLVFIKFEIHYRIIEFHFFKIEINESYVFKKITIDNLKKKIY